MKTNQNVDMVCMEIQIQNAQTTQDIINKLTEAAMAEVNSLATFSDSDATNITENIVNISTMITSKLTQDCMPSLIAKQALNCEDSTNVIATDLSYTAAQS